jgi:PAS domain S-box-containing protein
LYRKLIGTRDIGFVILNDKGVVVDANTKYARLAGRRDIDHVLGKSILDWTAQHDRDRLSRELAGCLKKGFARSVEIDHTDGQGGTTPVEMNVTRIGAGSGKDLVAFCRDVPKQRDAAGKPRRGTDGPASFTEVVPFVLKSTFFAVLENLPLGIIVADRSGVGKYVNPQFTGITGYTLDDVPTEKDWAVRAYPDEELRKKVVDAWKRNRSPGSTYEAAERSIACKNGREKVISLRATRLEELTIITLSDATEQRQIESALRHNEDRYRSIYENAIEGIFRAAPDGRFLSANPSHARMLGYDSSEDMVRDIASIGRQLFLDPENHRQFRETLQAQGIVEKFETRLRRRDGGTIWVSLNARTALNTTGEIAYYEGTAEDITGRKAMEEEKKQLEARLRQSEKMEAIGKLAGGIAHDFNNILEVLLGHCGILKMQIPKDGRLQERVRQIADTIEKASSFTKSLLAFSRKQDVVLKPVAINAMIRKACASWKGCCRRISPSRWLSAAGM